MGRQGGRRLHSVFEQVDADAVHAQYDKLSGQTPVPAQVHNRLDAAREEVPAFTAFPNRPWHRPGPTTPTNDSTAGDTLAHRSGHLPRPTRDPGLVGARAGQQNDEWADGDRYLGLELLQRCRLTMLPTDATNEENTTGAPSAGNPTTTNHRRTPLNGRWPPVDVKRLRISMAGAM